MTHAEIAALLADIGARIEHGSDSSGCIVAIDNVTAAVLRGRIRDALASLGRAIRIEVEVAETRLVDSHDTPSGLPVVATIHGPHALGRTLPGVAVLEIVGPPRRSS